MSATTNLVDAMNDDLSPVKDTNEEVNEEAETTDTNTDSETTEDAEYTSDDDTTEDDGYVIDDEEEEKPKEVEQPKETQPSNLNPEQKYIYDNLPTLSVTGKDGKRYDVKVPNELPDDFEYANAREQANFTSAVASQEIKANTLQNQYQTQASDKSAEEFATREDKAITDDIASLQKLGDIPTFKKKPSDPDFDSDPTAVLIDNVREFMDKRNDDFLKRYNAGQAYRHIGFEEAFYAYRRANPETTRSTEQQAEDKQRKEVGRNVSSKGTKATGTKRPQVRSGMQTRDLYAMIDNMDD